MTLWILFCRMTRDVDTLFAFYARDRHHVELKADEILKIRPVTYQYLCQNCSVPLLLATHCCYRMLNYFYRNIIIDLGLPYLRW